MTLGRYTGVQGGAESGDCHLLALMCLEKHWETQLVMVRTDSVLLAHWTTGHHDASWEIRKS